MSLHISGDESVSQKTLNVEERIIEIHTINVEDKLKEEVLKSLQQTDGPKTFPTMLLYDERGLQLFEDITYLEQYYPTKTEIDILESSSYEIASNITSGSMVVELGSGNLRKVITLLEAFEKQEKTIDYYALDLCFRELKRTLKQVPEFRYVSCYGLHGTYDDGLEWLKKTENKSRSKLVLSLGSSLGNFQRHEAQELLSSFSNVLQHGDLMLIGVDHTSEASKVYQAYNDREGTTHEFILNGLKNANQILETEVFNLADWKVIGEYVFDEEGGRHQAFLTPKFDFYYGNNICIRAGERVQIERSLKYSVEGVDQLWEESGLGLVKRWTHSAESYNLHLLTKSMAAFDLNPALFTSSSVPTIQEWRNMWSIWDTVAKAMTPKKILHEKPIELRNPLIFYLGHIPTFLDMQISKVTDGSLGQNSYFTQIFARGIDPDVENPEQCHNHSVAPNSWPSVKDILEYQGQIRCKLEDLYKTANNQFPRDIARAIWLSFEHEAMHIETYLYMLLQSGESFLPPKKAPNFEAEAMKAKEARVPNQWFKVPKQQIKIGLDDPEDNTVSEGPFGWDNEKPSRLIEVEAFEAQARPLTNEDYWIYLQESPGSKLPASWVSGSETNGMSNSRIHESSPENKLGGSHMGTTKSDSVIEKDVGNLFVRTFYGLIPLKHILDWPVYASYDELAECAKWMNGRIPTFEEVRSIYSFVDKERFKENKKADDRCFQDIHRSNDKSDSNNNHKLQEKCKTLSLDRSITNDLFADLDSANVGLKNWHPIAVTGHGNCLAGQAEMGGVWEWTSSILQEFEGFKPASLYPEYTADFFDGKHNIVLGGSWATHPRIAGRKSFINWYQRNYPYTWAGARLVRNI